MATAPLPRPFGLVLAGGRSRRMGGGDKGLLTLGGRPLLAHVIGRLAPQVGTLALNANGDPARFAAFGLPVEPDGVPDQPGPLAGVLAGLDRAAAEGAAAVVTVAADTPFLPADLVARLEAAAGPSGFAIAASDGPDGALRLHPTAGLWPVSLREALRAALARGERKVALWAQAQGAAVCPFPSGPADPFFNVNTPDDLAAAEALLAAGA